MGQRGGYADPSLIIAAELAFDRLAVEKGQWMAFGRIMAPDAILFRPDPVFAERWLKGRRNPPVPIRWETRQVFMACDGSNAISTGIWTVSGSEGGRGRFTNIWRRDKGGYRLILSHDSPLATVEAARGEDELEAITARVATCAKRGRPGDRGGSSQGVPPDAAVAAPPLDLKQPLPISREDRANDGSLRWRWSVAPGAARLLEAWMATEEGEMAILTDPIGSGGS